MAYGEDNSSLSRRCWIRPDIGGGVGEGGGRFLCSASHVVPLELDCGEEAATIPGDNKMSAEGTIEDDFDWSLIEYATENGSEDGNPAAGSDEPADPVMPAHSSNVGGTSDTTAVPLTLPQSTSHKSSADEEGTSERVTMMKWGIPSTQLLVIL